MKTETIADYGWQDQVAPHSSDYVAPAVQRQLARLGARRVLDIGAGNGDLCRRLAAAGIDAVGLERDSQGVEIARRAHPSVRFHCHSVDDDPAALLRDEAPFDTVVSTEVIEHLYAPERLPRYAHAVLAPGGHLVLTTPYHGYLKNLALSVADKWDHHHTVLWAGGHIKFFSRATLSELLRDNGFDVVDFQGLGRMPWLWKSMLLVARKRN
jgi:2-polyprenyl-6-hydroxyphenyl methylase/3-demethylubiquinone-9 3-methyltransferase